jgi:hypothetical protein
LFHHPALGREGQILTTTITNLDIHDMARSVRTYGLEALYVVHPLPSQRMLAERIVNHWVDGSGGKRIPDRAVALKCVRIAPDIDTVLTQMSLPEATSGQPDAGDAAEVELWTTAATASGTVVDHAAAKRLLAQDGPPVVIGFGTGWGLAPEVHDRAHLRLAPISASLDSGFNHLSVRAACAISLDRLFG